jgi:dolichol-phosphate mannosyltransferase
LGIVTPMASEAATARNFAREVLAQCEGVERVSFFIVLDNVCRDGTRSILEAFALNDDRLKVVWAPENRSVVDAYLRGYREAIAAECDWILEIDGGFSHRPQDIPSFLDKMSQGYDCVFATRFAGGGRIEDSSMKRKYISWGGTLLTKLLLQTRLSDMTSGFEIFRREVLAAALPHIHSRGPFFQTEIKAYCHRFRFTEVPIVYRAASHNVSNASLKDALSNLWRLFRQRNSQVAQPEMAAARRYPAAKH